MQIKLWAAVMPQAQRNEGNCIKAILGIHVCEDHRWEIEPSEFFLPEARDQIGAGLAAVGRPEPDFDSAEFVWVPLREARGVLGGLDG